MRSDARPHPGTPPPRSRARRLTATVLTAILLASLVPLALGTLAAIGDGDLASLFFYLVFLLLPMSLGLVGFVLTTRRPDNRIGWLLLTAAVCAGVAFASGEYARSAIAAGNTQSPDVVVAAWLGSWLFIPAVGILVLFLPLLYPSGELPGRRWRIVAVIGVVGIALGAIGPALASGPLADPLGPANPFAPPDPLGSWIELIATASNLVAPPIFLLAVGSLLLRFRRSTGVERQQIKWFLFVAALASLAFGTSIVAPGGPVSDIAWVLGILTMSFLPVAIGLAILRYRLYEIDRIVNRAVVYGALTAVLAGVFAAATSLSQRLFISVAGQSSDASIVLTTLLVVAVYAPVRKRVESVVDRYFKYDQREFGPYLDELRRLLALVEPHRAAERLAREALVHTGASGVAVTAPGGGIVATAGTWPAEPVTRVSAAHGAPFAAVLLGPRRDGRPHPARRIEALEQVAALAVEALHGDGRDRPRPAGADAELTPSRSAASTRAVDEPVDSAEMLSPESVS
jgi:hypothetical protein